jgi:HAD superfamily hydrolase (TIGR01509 family)
VTSPVSLVVFDCDGVLVDSESISSRELAVSIRAAGLPISDAEVKAAFKGETLASVTSFVEQRLGRQLPATWLDEFQARRADAFRTELRAVPGARALVEAVMGEGIGVCVASQAALVKMELTLGLTGLRPLFSDDQLFSADMVPRGKPAPDLFLHAAARLGHGAESCVVIEDSVLGVIAARAAGMRAIAYAADGDSGALSDAGGELVHDLGEIAAILGLGA